MSSNNKNLTLPLIYWEITACISQLRYEVNYRAVPWGCRRFSVSVKGTSAELMLELVSFSLLNHKLATGHITLLNTFLLDNFHTSFSQPPSEIV